jgi:RNA polymerase sigma-70 factor, ECF subfamily
MLIELVERAKAGDDAAFNQLAGELLDRLYAVAYRIVRNPARAEDATQEAVVTAWRRLGSLRDPSRFEAWMHRILVNACRDELRRHRRGDETLHEDDSAYAAALDATVALEQRDALERAFTRLSADHRAVLVLRHYLLWSTADMADCLGIPGGTVSSRLHYAATALRAALEAEERPFSERSAEVGS